LQEESIDELGRYSESRSPRTALPGETAIQQVYHRMRFKDTDWNGGSWRSRTRTGGRSGWNRSALKKKASART